jgi:hypothetical protein
MRTMGLLALSCFALPVALAAQDPPRLVIAEEKHAIDEVSYAAPARWSFKVENQGGSPLTLEVLGVTALCQVEKHSPSVQPKGSGTVDVVLDTSELSAPGECSIKLGSNDPEHPTAVLQLAVAPQTVLKAKPGFARYTYVQGEAEGTIRQLVSAKDGKDFRVLEVKAPPEVRASFRAATDKERDSQVAGTQWVVETTIRADAPVGPLHGVIDVRTDHPEQKLMRVPLSGFVRPVLHVTPPQATIGDVTLDHEVKVELFLRNFATEPIHVLKVESSVPGTRAEIAPREEGRSWDLYLILTPAMGSGKFAGNLTISTDSYKLPKLVVPVAGSAALPPPPG